MDLTEITSREYDEVFVSNSDKLTISLSKIDAVISTDLREDSCFVSLTESFEIKGDSKCSEETALGVTESAVVGISISTSELIPLSIGESGSVISADSGEDSGSILLTETFKIDADFKYGEEIDLEIIESDVIGISISASELIGLDIKELIVANIATFAQDSDILLISETININKSLLMSDALIISTGKAYNLDAQNGVTDELSFGITEGAELDTVFVNIISEDSFTLDCKGISAYIAETTDKDTISAGVLENQIIEFIISSIDTLDINSMELTTENNTALSNIDSIILSLEGFISINTALLSSDNVILNMEDIGLLSFDTPRGDFIQIIITEDRLLNSQIITSDNLKLKFDKSHKTDITQESTINIAFGEICKIDAFHETIDYIKTNLQDDGSILSRLELVDYNLISIFDEKKELITSCCGHDINIIEIIEINITDKDLNSLDNLDFNIVEKIEIFKPEGVIYVEDTFKIGLDKRVHPMDIRFTDGLVLLILATPYIHKPGLAIIVSYSERFTRLSIKERLARLGVKNYGG